MSYSKITLNWFLINLILVGLVYATSNPAYVPASYVDTSMPNSGLTYRVFQTTKVNDSYWNSNPQIVIQPLIPSEYGFCYFMGDLNTDYRDQAGCVIDIYDGYWFLYASLIGGAYYCKATCLYSGSNGQFASPSTLPVVFPIGSGAMIHPNYLVMALIGIGSIVFTTLRI
jgi:hypothetical protein